MKTMHHEIEISYDESDDRWHFTLRGRGRSAETLSRAKEAIDKEPVEKRKQVFPRFEAYLSRYGSNVEIVTVIALGDEAWRGHPRFWVVNKDGKRSKEHAISLFPVNEKNTAIVAEIVALKKQTETLEDARSKWHEKLQCAVVPKELTDEGVKR